MNNQQVFDLWKELTANDRQTNVNMYKKIDDFVSGRVDVLEIEERLGGIRYFGWENYPKRLIAELEGDGAEVAKRALIAYSQVSPYGVADSAAAIPIAMQVGYSLSDCLFGKKNYLSDYQGYAQMLLKCYPKQAAELITVENIKKIAECKPVYVKGSLTNLEKIGLEEKSKSSTEARYISLLIAREMIVNGAVNSEEMKDAICDAAEKLFPNESTAIICGIFEGHKGLTEMLKKNLKSARCAEIYMNYYGKLPRKEIFDKLGICDDYMYLTLCGKLDRKNYSSILAEAAADEALAMRMIERAEKESDSRALCMMAYLAAKAKELGGGKKETERLEMHFGEMLGDLKAFDLIVGDFKMRTSYKADLFIPAVYDDPVKASEMIEYHSGHLTSNTWNKNAIIKAFAALYDCSAKAKAIYTALLLAANEDIERACLISCFIKGRFDVLKLSYYDSFERLFADGINIDIIFGGMAGCHESWFYDKQIESAEFVTAHSEEAMAYFKKISSNAKRAAWFAELLVKKGGFFEPEFAITLFTHKSKVIQKIIGDIMASKEDELRPEFEKALPKMKGDAKSRSEALLKRWENARKYGKNFDFPSSEVAEMFVEENFTNAHEKAVGFIPEELMTDVRFADLKGTASANYIKYIIGEYMVLDAPANLPVCGKLAAMLHAPDLQDCLENIVQNWIDEGADTKKKMVLVPYCVHGSDGQVMGMKKQLTVWAGASRGALAAFAVTAMAVNGKSPALMTVSDISNKFPSNMVKKAARAAFSYAAKSFGVTEDILADRIVPALGFDKNGERVIDYGTRQFTVSLMPDFSLKIFDNEKGKEVKSLPKPGANDDAAKAEAAKKEFSEIKKQIKAVITSQKSRMEIVFRNGRTWDKTAWDELFGENPLMNIIARSLIWGVYDEDKKLLKSFRYSDDGTLCDENDDIYELPEEAHISLVHPIELSEESIEAWSEQLSDYEIVQPFPQISASIIKLEDDEIGEDNKIVKYSGKTFTVGSIGGAAKKYNMERSSVEDGGGFSGYHIRDKELGVGFAVHGEEMYMGQSFDESVKVSEVFFYELPEEEEDKPSSYTQYKAVNPANISSRFVSCCLNIAESFID
ncbi:MAG: DUF4132 domain-containing protein [Oscillospiraceae bacterium]|nr:DUF4132 domain-containing protein [Oscillospiraceae bacterium]